MIIISGRKLHHLELSDMSYTRVRFYKHAQSTLLLLPGMNAILLVRCLRPLAPLNLSTFITILNITKLSCSSFSGNLMGQLGL